MSEENSPLVQKLWNDWLTEKCDHAANKLVKHYKYIVNFHVDRIGSHLPKNVSKDDLVSFGLLGLYDAITKFDEKRNLKFDTYASFRIKGAIMDGLRKEDWLPRSLREKAKKVERVSGELEQKLQRMPTSKEIGKQLDMSPEEVETIVKDALFSNVLSIEEKPKNENDFNEGIGYTIPDDQAISPEEELYMEELKQELVEAIKKLNKN